MTPSVDRIQSATGLDAVFSPMSVAVIGASPNPSSVGHRIMASILRHGYGGPVYPIHPTAKEVLGIAARPTVLDVQGPVDLAVVAVPAPAVLAVVQHCAQKGVRGLVVVSAGFRETGPDGSQMEKELGELARNFKMRLIGPNCLGVVNADPNVRLHAIFSDTPADGGNVALMTQSGALGIALLDRAHELGLGIGAFVSMGNKIDVSGNDLLLQWEADPRIKLILMHLESLGNPRNFIRIARRVMMTKPILLVKGGRTAGGAKAAGSHTGALMESEDLVNATVRQAGVLRVSTVEELFDAAFALNLLSTPKGNRVGIVTNSGGPAILMADALPANGLELAELSPATLDAVRPRLPRGAAIANPLDMLAGASPDNLTACLLDLMADDGVDTVVAMATPLVADDRPWARAILEAKAQGPDKPMLAVLFGRDNTSAGFQELIRGGVPTYTFPENAANALAALVRVGEFLRQPQDQVPATQPARVDLSAIAAGSDANRWASNAGALNLAETLGAAYPKIRLFPNPEEVVRAKRELDYPVALKIQAPGLVHKTEAGAVVLGVRSAEELEREAPAMWQRVKEAGFEPNELLVQRMAPGGVEILVGAVQDAKFGAVITVGLGGTYTEVLRDVATRLAPVTPAEAERMIASLKANAILQGIRGEPPRDIAALRDFVVRLGQLMAEHPEIAEFEVNPVRVLPRGQGILALDARLRFAEP